MKAQIFKDKELTQKLRKASSSIISNNWKEEYGMNVGEAVDDLIGEIKEELKLK